MTDPSPIDPPSIQLAEASLADPPKALSPHNETDQLAQMLKDIQASTDDLQRVSRALNALASLTTSGNPIHTHLEVVNSEDLGALFNVIGDYVATKTRALDDLVHQAAEVARRR